MRGATRIVVASLGIAAGIAGLELLLIIGFLPLSALIAYVRDIQAQTKQQAAT